MEGRGEEEGRAKSGEKGNESKEKDKEGRKKGGERERGENGQGRKHVTLKMGIS